MANENQARAWDHTSNISCFIIRMGGDPKKTKGITPQSLHPYEKQKKGRSSSRGGNGLAITRGNIRILKSIFVDGFNKNTPHP